MEGRLVVEDVIPALVHVDLSTTGPVVTKSPERGPATALVGGQMRESGNDEAVLVRGCGLESDGVTASEAGTLKDGLVVDSEVDFVVAGDLCQALCLSIGEVLVNHEARVGVGFLYYQLVGYVRQVALWQ